MITKRYFRLSLSTLLFSLSMLLITSCSDFLDKDIQGNATDETYYDTPYKLQSALDAVYDVLYQPGQFAPDYGVPELDEIAPTEAQYEAVRLAITETPILEPDVVFFATSPIYGELFLHVGGHYFTRYPE